MEKVNVLEYLMKLAKNVAVSQGKQLAKNDKVETDEESHDDEGMNDERMCK